MFLVNVAAAVSLRNLSTRPLCHDPGVRAATGGHEAHGKESQPDRGEFLLGSEINIYSYNTTNLRKKNRIRSLLLLLDGSFVFLHLVTLF